MNSFNSSRGDDVLRDASHELMGYVLYNSKYKHTRKQTRMHKAIWSLSWSRLKRYTKCQLLVTGVQGGKV